MVVTRKFGSNTPNQSWVEDKFWNRVAPYIGSVLLYMYLTPFAEKKNNDTSASVLVKVEMGSQYPIPRLGSCAKVDMVLLIGWSANSSFS